MAEDVFARYPRLIGGNSELGQADFTQTASPGSPPP
jgi:hypothetical protein